MSPSASPSRPPRSRKELVAASGDLLYELQRFFECWSVLSTRWPELERLGTVFEEGIAVAFLVHGRSLANVFFPTFSRQQDVIAEDFFPDPADWNPSRHVSEVDLKAIRRWVGRDAAHVSYARITRGSDRRDYGLILGIVRDAAIAFADAVPPDRVIAEFAATTRGAAHSTGAPSKT